MILTSTPKTDGFYMPAEFAPHQATVMIFPERPGSWINGARPAQEVFSQIIREIAKVEQVYIIVSKFTKPVAKEMLSEVQNISLIEIPTDDAWARDTAPTFVTNGKVVRGIDWQFNAWGGNFDGLYAHWDNDNKLAKALCKELSLDVYDAQHFVLEGGSIHSDGEGTILVTESCLLSGGRNPHLKKYEIAQVLCDNLGGEKVIWLPRGIYNDETNEHVDNVCAFIAPSEVVLAWTDNEDDPQFPLSKACLDMLENETDAKGRKFTVHKLPIPDKPVCITQDELDGYEFEEGEDVREVGERLAASYVNFYFANDILLLPQFGGENAGSDLRAVKLMSEWCSERRIIPIPARQIIIGGGNIHCITQQIPKGDCTI